MGTLMFFGHCGTCKRCKKAFNGSSSRNYCMTCFPIVRSWAQRQQQRNTYQPRRRHQSPAQEAYEQGDADMYRRALNGELD